ncbi:Polysialic acid transport protein KpsM [Jannaschia aquimarina]|uniref:KpsM protein n=1 Tax=Jannaschia aquimarina TaxID=935700 RepID=A0A0D1EFE6_9RHOB|nr:Polysialic acid transport protein KpsM [Jannaschia aquimarina]SNT27768.1 capsular polysaccharide transport system permease protein [Jannaschia aquimarina]
MAGIALLTFIFSAAFRSPPLGISFPIFYATGMLPFLLFNSTTNKIGSCLRYSKQLLAYPTVTFADAVIARTLLTVTTQLMVSYLLLSMSLLLFDTLTSLNLAIVLQGYALAVLLAIGVGTLNCYFTTRFDIYGHAWAILTRPLFIISGVFILYDGIPEPFKSWLWWNPLIHVIGLVRRGFYPNYDAAYVSVTYVLVFSLIPLAFGLVLLRRNYRDLLDRL